MVYPENFESKIKFDKIRQFVQKNCLSDMGRDLVEAMKFSTEPTEIRERLEETQEFMSILEEEDQFPGDHFSDARPFLNKVRVEGLFLEVAEMVALKQSLESLTAIVRFFHGKDERYPRLTAQAGDIQPSSATLLNLESLPYFSFNHFCVAKTIASAIINSSFHFLFVEFIPVFLLHLYINCFPKHFCAY